MNPETSHGYALHPLFIHLWADKRARGSLIGGVRWGLLKEGGTNTAGFPEILPFQEVENSGLFCKVVMNVWKSPGEFFPFFDYRSSIHFPILLLEICKINRGVILGGRFKVMFYGLQNIGFFGSNFKREKLIFSR